MVWKLSWCFGGRFPKWCPRWCSAVTLETSVIFILQQGTKVDALHTGHRWCGKWGVCKGTSVKVHFPCMPWGFPGDGLTWIKSAGYKTQISAAHTQVLKISSDTISVFTPSATFHWWYRWRDIWGPVPTSFWWRPWRNKDCNSQTVQHLFRINS